MDLELTEDQKLFRTTTVKFLENEAPLEKVRELNKSGEGFPRDFWSQGAELGWAALLVPEDLGGGSISGEGFKDLASMRSVGLCISSFTFTSKAN